MMPRLVTGVYYERGEAEQAVAALREKGIPAEEIFLEAEVSAGPEAGWMGGEMGRLEQERRVAGRESGVLMGMTFGALSGLGISVLGGVLQEWMTRVPANEGVVLPAVLAMPWLAGLAGALIGLAVGYLVGWVVDYTLTRLGAGPPLPAHEALVTVQTDDAHLDQVRATMFRTHARHLHLADRPIG
jgi:hypothetical protein